MAENTRRAKSAARAVEAVEGFTDEERAAMKARVQEMKAEARRGAKKADGERDLLSAIAETVLPGTEEGEGLSDGSYLTWLNPSKGAVYPLEKPMRIRVTPVSHHRQGP